MTALSIQRQETEFKLALIVDWHALEVDEEWVMMYHEPKADEKRLSVACASVVAKVCRDWLMVELDSTFPGYGFAANKGYGTPRHLEALRRLGPSPAHRPWAYIERVAGTDYR